MVIDSLQFADITLKAQMTRSSCGSLLITNRLQENASVLCWELKTLCALIEMDLHNRTSFSQLRGEREEWLTRGLWDTPWYCANSSQSWHRGARLKQPQRCHVLLSSWRVTSQDMCVTWMKLRHFIELTRKTLFSKFHIILISSSWQYESVLWAWPQKHPLLLAIGGISSWK